MLFRSSEKRTLIRMILIPLLVFPVIINLVTMVQSSAAEKEATKKVNVGYVLNGQSSEMIDNFSMVPNYNFIEFTASIELTSNLLIDSITLAFPFASTFHTDYVTGNSPD